MSKVNPFNYKEMQEKFYKTPADKLAKPLTPFKMPRLPRISADYYYLACKLDGRMILLGPYDTSEEAYAVGAKKLSTPYEVVALKTKDRSKATSIMRHKILNSSSDLGLSLRRMKHRI